MALSSPSPRRFRVRLASSEDVSTVISIVNAAFAVETFLDGTRTDAERMARMKREGEILIAEEIFDQDQISGIARKNEDMKSVPGRIHAAVYVEVNGERGYFGMLAVDPASRGTGLGRLMVEAAENFCRQCSCRFMDIDVLSLRPELPPFYRKLGYTEAGTEEFHPSRPLRPGIECHCIKMEKAL